MKNLQRDCETNMPGSKSAGIFTYCDFRLFGPEGLFEVARKLGRYGYFAVGCFKFPYALAYKVQNLTVCRASLVFGYIVQLIMQYGIDFNSEVLVVFVSHNTTYNLNLSTF